MSIFKNRMHYDVILVFILALFLFLCIAPDIVQFTINPDAGFHLAAGSQILFGKIPIKDLIIVYGPLAEYLPALGQFLYHSPISEIIICALGYAVSIVLIYCIVKKYASWYYAIPCIFCAIVLISRFYKWYYWLFPLLILYLFLLEIHHPAPNYKWKDKFFVMGILTGISGLFRWDLLLFIIIFLILFSLISKIYFKPENRIKIKFLKFLMGLIIPLFAWVSYSIFEGISINDQIVMFWNSIKDHTESVSAHFPILDIHHPISGNLGLILLILLIVSCLIIGILYPILTNCKYNKGNNQIIFASSLLGILLLGQFFQSPEINHLLQVIPIPLIVITLMLATGIDHIKSEGFISNHFSFHSSIVSYILCFLGIIIVIFSISPFNIPIWSDFSYNSMNPLPKYMEFYHNDYSRIDINTHELFDFIDTHSSKNDSIIIFSPWNGQIVYFLDRPLTGLYIIYVPGLFAEDYWRIKNVNLILKDPPQFIILKRVDYENLDNSSLYISFPQVGALIKSKYKKAIFENNEWVVLSK